MKESDKEDDDNGDVDNASLDEAPATPKKRTRTKRRLVFLLIKFVPCNFAFCNSAITRVFQRHLQQRLSKIGCRLVLGQQSLGLVRTKKFKGFFSIGQRKIRQLICTVT